MSPSRAVGEVSARSGTDVPGTPSPGTTSSRSAPTPSPPSLADRLGQRLRHHRDALHLEPLPVDGTLTTLLGLTLQAEGCRAAVGSRCLVEAGNGRAIEAEVVGFDRARTLLMPAGPLHGVRPGARVRPLNRALAVPSGEALLGRVIDAEGEPIDGGGPLRDCPHQPRSAAPIDPLSRAAVDRPFDVGVRAINALLTLGRGQRIGLFAGSGVGKSALLGMMTRHSSAEVTVIALIGERGREVGDFVRDTLGPEGLEHAVVIAVPADRPPLARLQGAMLASAVAESFREAGRDVLLLVDSLTRVAQAQREIGLATGEPPTVKGYPPSVFATLPALVERAGAMKGSGSITAIYTVLAEGDDQNDPIADAARAVLDGHIVLSRELADAAHWPAIDIGASVSRTRNAVTGEREQAWVRRFLALSAAYRSKEDMLRVGLYQSGTDPQLDEAIRLWPRLQRFLRQRPEQGVSLAAAHAELAALFEEAGPTIG